MNWRLKALIRRAALALPGGEGLYRWLTAEVMGPNAGMAAKWFGVFPTHVKVLQSAFGDSARAQRLWCFDSGATLGAGLAMAVATDEPGLLTDRRDRLSSRYNAVSLDVLRRSGPALAELSHAPAGRVDELLTKCGDDGAAMALKAAGMTYAARHAVADEPEWQGTIACVFSAGTLEHYRPDEIEKELARMGRALKPGGLMSHVVDHRDHRWHADSRICPLQHLTLGEDEYDRNFDNPLDYHNRWLQSRYVELFGRLGFEIVECRTAIPYSPDLAPLDGQKLAPEFREACEEDLRSLVTHFVARRV